MDAPKARPDDPRLDAVALVLNELLQMLEERRQSRQWTEPPTGVPDKTVEKTDGREPAR
jgi:hypothetical protein